MTMTQREGFHGLTRSVMKELRDHTKWMVLHNNHKKRVLFTVRVDVWRRSENLPEDRAKRAGLGVSRRDRLAYTYDLSKKIEITFLVSVETNKVIFSIFFKFGTLKECLGVFVV